MPEKVAQIKKERDKQIQDVFTGNSDKFLVIIGPCSADNEECVCDYIRRLIPVQEKVKDKLIIIPRIYTNKPRTTGDGYKGLGTPARPGEEARPAGRSHRHAPSAHPCRGGKRPDGCR